MAFTSGVVNKQIYNLKISQNEERSRQLMTKLEDISKVAINLGQEKNFLDQQGQKIVNDSTAIRQGYMSAVINDDPNADSMRSEAEAQLATLETQYNAIQTELQNLDREIRRNSAEEQALQVEKDAVDTMNKMAKQNAEVGGKVEDGALKRFKFNA